MKEKLEFRIATEDWEFEQIADLNYRTFVEEIPQHGENKDRALLDKFHSENTYIICKRGKKLLGMLAVRDKRPFSLDHKLQNLDTYLPEHSFACEFRLLSIEQEHRNLRIIQGLLVILARFADEKGYDIALISANTKRLKFYKQFGFKPFGPEVGTDEAPYQPMYLTLQSSLEFRKKSKIMTRVPENFTIENKRIVNLLPGPVRTNPGVKRAMTEPAISHRSVEFKIDFNRVRGRLCELACSKKVEVLMGSGTLANDVVAAQLSIENKKGLILSNGEFGERLVDHAQRVGLEFEVIKLPWGEIFDYGIVESSLIDHPEIKWLWFVHSETSTGVLNDLERVKLICNRQGVRVCVDCVSSIGLVPLELRGVHLASGVSGKGLASYPGLSFVFYNDDITPSDSIPRYLDLGYYAKCDGIPFTMSSNLVYALGESLKTLDAQSRFKEIKELSNWVRKRISGNGFDILTTEDHAAPGLITISLPQWLSSRELGERLEDKGFLLHWKSLYLLDRNWIQVAFMGRHKREEITPLIEFLSDLEKPLSKAL